MPPTRRPRTGPFVPIRLYRLPPTWTVTVSDRLPTAAGPCCADYLEPPFDDDAPDPSATLVALPPGREPVLPVGPLVIAAGHVIPDVLHLAYLFQTDPTPAPADHPDPDQWNPPDDFQADSLTGQPYDPAAERADMLAAFLALAGGSPPRVAAFAARYGFLRWVAARTVTAPDGSPALDPTGRALFAEPLALWTTEAARMADVLSTLADLRRQAPRASARRDPAAAQYREQLAARWQDMHDDVARGLDRWRVRPVLRATDPRHVSQLHLLPRDLGGVLWTFAALRLLTARTPSSTDTETRFVTCALDGCGAVFTARRPQDRYCCPKHRKLAWYRREAARARAHPS